MIVHLDADAFFASVEQAADGRLRGKPVAVGGSKRKELAAHADALRDSLEIAEQCNFEFDLGGLRFPRYYPVDGSTAHDFLRRLTIEGVRRRYAQMPKMLALALSQIEEELGIIAEVGYEEYFLLTWEILEDCKAEGNRVDHTGHRGGQSRLLLPGHFRCLPARSG
jgi:DNA polymerase III alpha subunit